MLYIICLAWACIYILGVDLLSKLSGFISGFIEITSERVSSQGNKGMGIFDDPLSYVQDVVDVANDVGDIDLADFDLTNPNAEHGEKTGMVTDFIANIVTEGGAGTLFSDGAQALGEFHELTGNDFTANNIGDTIQNAVEDVGDAIGDLFGF
ncbi:hypothetical protein H6F50_18775 [Coleofasciculus sp. FACHB-712]|uniref:hypothetical protein n=1 Tax=Coleofasciculus sp. FACHB-712 TaxID=2692789 RepID=UPI0016889A52|nr:hypothetical protein [Coleofasciculus sp. FACHB-712]MBD1944373.1 hypothetical protein [Coleofasciculus sp. FACHB-712]